MKYIPVFLLAAALCCGCSSLLLNKRTISAAGMALHGATLTDAQVARMSREFIAASDRESAMAADTSQYATRLRALTDPFRSEDGLDLNFAVYVTPEINAFACADGSIRVYSGLMDVMTDEELAAIIGHEIGHVRHNDTKEAMKRAYYASAATTAIGGASPTLEKLTSLEVDKLVTSFISAQFSQQQELAADDYSFDFVVRHGYNPYAMANALEKIARIAGSDGEQAGRVAQWFSSHPDSDKRAGRMKQKAFEHVAGIRR